MNEAYVLFELYPVHSDGEINLNERFQIEAKLTQLPRVGEDIEFAAHYKTTGDAQGTYTVVEVKHIYDVSPTTRNKPDKEKHASLYLTLIRAVTTNDSTIANIKEIGNKLRLAE